MFLFFFFQWKAGSSVYVYTKCLSFTNILNVFIILRPKHPSSCCKGFLHRNKTWGKTFEIKKRYNTCKDRDAIKHRAIALWPRRSRDWRHEVTFVYRRGVLIILTLNGENDSFFFFFFFFFFVVFFFSAEIGYKSDISRLFGWTVKTICLWYHGQLDAPLTSALRPQAIAIHGTSKQ